MQVKKYAKIWMLMAIKVSQVAFVSRFGAVFFIVAKILRFVFFLLFLLLLSSKVKTVSGYSIWQMVFFFATFNIVDVTAQFFLREVYKFQQYIKSGTFDFYLTKPFSPLFRSLFGGADIIDLPILLLSVGLIFLASWQIGSVSFLSIAAYVFLICNALIIVCSFHILVLAIGVLSTEIDSALWLYRDVTLMGRIPIDIYTEPIRFLLTFVVPVGIMMTLPAKAFMGLLSFDLLVVSLLIGGIFLFLSLRFWDFSLKRYASASS